MNAARSQPRPKARRTPRSAVERASTTRIFRLRPERPERAEAQALEKAKPVSGSSALSPEAVARERDAALANHDGLAMLYAEAAGHALLSRDEEVALARRAQAGDAAARERFLNANIRLVSKVAAHYARPGSGRGGREMADLIDDGVEGLIHALELYDPERGYRFSTYATLWIRQRIARALIDKGDHIRLPAFMAQRVQFLKRLRGQMEAQSGATPTAEELADVSGLLLEQVQHALAIIDGAVGAELMSLDVEYVSRQGGDPFNLADLIVDPRASAAFEAIERTTEADAPESVTSIMRDLAARGPVTRRMMEIVALRVLRKDQHDATLAMVGERFGITRERARQLEAAGLRRIRDERDKRRRAHERQQMNDTDKTARGGQR